MVHFRYDKAILVAHQSSIDGSNCCQPSVIETVTESRPRQLKVEATLGHGIVLAPPPYNHPARVAERIATLDLVSNGRVDFGTGESASRAELV